MRRNQVCVLNSARFGGVCIAANFWLGFVIAALQWERSCRPRDWRTSLLSGHDGRSLSQALRPSRTQVKLCAPLGTRVGHDVRKKLLRCWASIGADAETGISLPYMHFFVQEHPSSRSWDLGKLPRGVAQMTSVAVPLTS